MIGKIDFPVKNIGELIFLSGKVPAETGTGRKTILRMGSVGVTPSDSP
jgi:hypothetical protein